MSSRDLTAVVKTQRVFIKELLDRLENKQVEKEIIVSKPKLFFHDVPLDIDELNACLNDSYFTDLNLQQIFELAKKSVRLTDDNCKMRHKLEDIAEVLAQKDLCSECKAACCTKFSEKIKNILDK